MLSGFNGLFHKPSWGETTLFYNPEKTLANGVYFCTIKQKNSANDIASHLDREGIFRFSFSISKKTYENKFGPKPKRPSKGCIIKANFDFTALNQLMPHPIYGWMSWVQILNPDAVTLAKLYPLLSEAYTQAVNKFNKKQKTSGHTFAS